VSNLYALFRHSRDEGYSFHLTANQLQWAPLPSRYRGWLRAGRSGDRIPVKARFSAPVLTGPGAHPASCTMGAGSFPGVKSGRRGDADPSPPSSAVGHERVQLYLYSPYGPYGLYRASVPVQGCTLLLHLPNNYRGDVRKSRS
jgi:hypothetical protein